MRSSSRSPLHRTNNHSIVDSQITYSERIWRVLFPPRCAGCNIWSDSLFCEFCSAQIKPIRAPLCALCGQGFDPNARVLDTSICAECRENRYHASPPLCALRSPLEYSGPVREAIHTFKYRGKTARASQMAALLGAYLTGAPEALPLRQSEIQFLVPVPLHGWRQWRRGYNQSTLLAQELSKWLSLNSSIQAEVFEVLQRVRYTTPQVELSGDEREQNIKGAFALDESKRPDWGHVNAGAILLIDDVTTTGATLFECARVLQKSGGVGADRLFALTLARSGKAL